jgi:predicted nucleic acid-binding protein
MSAEARREFVDTNVLVYAFDTSAGYKQAIRNDSWNGSGMTETAV